MKHTLILLLLNVMMISCGCNSESNPAPSVKGNFESCHVENGVLLSEDGNELSLWGLNFQTPISWEANRLAKAGIPKNQESLKKVADRNLEDAELMNAHVLRCHLTPGDFTDNNGNLIENIYLDALDYLVSEAPKRGMRLIFAFLNDMGQKGPGTDWTGKGAETWVHDINVVRCTRRYISQLVRRINPYNGKVYGNNPDIAYWELINEPRAYSYSDLKNTTYYQDFKKWISSNGKPDNEATYAVYRENLIKDYIDGTINILRENNDCHSVCWSLNWHRYRTSNTDIFRGAASSKADIVSFCNYPGQDLVSQDYWNNRYDFTQTDFSGWFNKYLQKTDGYGWAKTESFKTKCKAVYEFETFFNQSAYLYPVQALYFKALDAQTASMWTYTFAEIAEKFGGSHFLNIRCTPRKAASFIVAGKIFENTDRNYKFTAAPEMSGSTWRISKSADLAIYSDGKSWCSSSDVPENWASPAPSGNETYVAGCGNSPLVKYSGSGLYIIKEVDGELVVHLMPDIKVVGDHFVGSNYKSIVTELDYEKSNNLSILLNNWKSRKCSIYTSTGEAISEINGTTDMTLKPGKYIIKTL